MCEMCEMDYHRVPDDEPEPADTAGVTKDEGSTEEPRIVLSGPIKIKVDLAAAQKMYVEHVLATLSEEELKQFIQEWALGKLQQQALEQEGEGQNG